MGCSYLDIVFDRESGTYTSGELVTGKVLANFTKPVELRGVRLNVVGKSKVRWTEKRNKHRHTYTGEESYFSSEFVLDGNESGSNITLPAGEVIYPFNVQLPPDLPNSFEHKYGHIRYTVEATFDRPWKFDYDIKVPFQIVSEFDLNSRPEASEEIQDEIEQTFCCCCWSQGMISMPLSIPSSGFVPGQTIPVTIQCDNESNIDVTAIQFSLKQKLIFHATSFLSNRTKNAEEVVMRVMYDEPFPNKSKNPVTLELVVPMVPASDLKNCGIIDLIYLLKIKVYLSGWHCSLDRSFNVLIGTVPLINSWGIDGSNNATAPLPTAPHLVEPFTPAGQEFSDLPAVAISMPMPLPIGFTTNSSEPSSGNPDSPPPSYEECVHEAGGVSGKSKAELTQLAQVPSAPQYPVNNSGPTNDIPKAPDGGKS